MSHRSRVPARVIEFLVAATLAASGALPAFAAEIHRFDIPAEEAPAAIRDFGSQAHVQILVAGERVKDKQLHAVSGELSTDQGLKVLLADSGLTPQYVSDRSIALVPESETSAGTPDTVTTEKQAEQASGKKYVQLEEVVVTGSRLTRATAEGAQEVKVYSRERIDQSGQTSVADFLNTLPDVSVGSSESGLRLNSNFSTTSVQLHGLPVGTTLVLLNGRRIENSGASYGIGYFDLNAIPTSAVERIEVVSEGSSAVYGSDAIAGVINVILKKEFDGVEAGARHGFADGVDDSNADLAWGRQWGKGSVSVMGTFQTRSELQGSERALTASQNFAAFGGPDNRVKTCNPGNVATTDGSALPGAPAGSSSSFAAIAADAAGNPRQTGFRGTYGSNNKCSQYGYYSLLPESHRYGLLASANYRVTPSVELFMELGFSYLQQMSESAPQVLSGLVPATNPYNPFGKPVTVNGSFTTAGRTDSPLDTVFHRELVGARGELFGSWQWEIAAWQSHDRTSQNESPYLNRTALTKALNSTDPATALNPFVAGNYGSPQLLNSLFYSYDIRYGGQSRVVDGLIRGPLVQLPAGPVEIVIGSEYDRDTLDESYLPTPTSPAGSSFSFQRNRYAVFCEARLPILANRANPQGGDLLAATVAGRYDHYGDFGGVLTPEYGAELRPWESLLVRGTYGKAFKAPDLANLYGVKYSYQMQVVDPLNGNGVQTATVNGGGNPNLRPETGQSRTLGLVYSSRLIPNLQFSLTHWAVEENQAIQYIPPQTIVANQASFPGRVTRAPGQNGQPGVIIAVNASESNFGLIDVSGFDYQLSYRLHTEFGDWSPSIAVTQTVRYETAFTPGAPVVDQTSKANDDGDWAPRLKGSIALGWKRGPFTASADGRYVGKYRDYDPLPNGTYRTLGNFWLYDANFRYGAGEAFAPRNQWLRGLYVELGGVNLFNSLPRYSNFYSGLIGYDAAEADIRGRYLYGGFGIKW